MPIDKMPEFYMILPEKLSKCPNVYDICPEDNKIPEIYMIIVRKIFFHFWEGGGARALPCPVSYAYALCINQSDMIAQDVIANNPALFKTVRV